MSFLVLSALFLPCVPGSMRPSTTAARNGHDARLQVPVRTVDRLGMVTVRTLRGRDYRHIYLESPEHNFREPRGGSQWIRAQIDALPCFRSGRPSAV